MQSRCVGVVGLGVMGSGIVEVFARGGFTVIAIAESDDAVQLGRSNLDNSLNRALSRSKISDIDADEIRSLITWTTEFELLATSDLAIEAAPERLDIKREIFQKLDQCTAPEAILATNTSSLSVTEIAQGVQNPARVFGLHFFNPAPVQKLVEIVTTDFSDSTLLAHVQRLAGEVGKTAITISDSPGFIVNRILLAYLNHAADLVDSKQYTIREIDAAVRDVAEFPLGPFELLDLIGLDTSLEILQVMFTATGRSNLKPAKSLSEHVASRHLGRKSGQGFYEYPRDDESVHSTNEDRATKIVTDLLSGLVKDSRDLVATGYASTDEIDLAMKLGCGLPYGPSEVPRHLLQLD